MQNEESLGIIGLSADRSVSRLAEGDVGALSQLYSLLRRPVFLLALSILGDHALAEDVMQETFLKINEHAGSYRPGTNPKAWVLAITRNLALNMLRRRSREQPGDDLLESLPCAEGGSASPAVGTGAGDADDRLDFARTMAQLGEPERSIVTMRVVCGLRHREIAKILGCAPGDVRVRYSRALKKLRSYYGNI